MALALIATFCFMIVGLTYKNLIIELIHRLLQDNLLLSGLKFNTLFLILDRRKLKTVGLLAKTHVDTSKGKSKILKLKVKGIRAIKIRHQDKSRLYCIRNDQRNKILCFRIRNLLSSISFN